MSDQVKEPAAAYPLPATGVRYTWDDYATWEGRWEIIDGVPHDMTPTPFFPHCIVVSWFAFHLMRQFGRSKTWAVVTDLDWIIDRHTTICPDLMVARLPIGERWLNHPPHLVLEVLSHSTAMKDRTLKKNLCEKQGVRYFLLADPASRILEAFALTDGAYQRLPDTPELPLSFEGVEIRIPVAEIWG